MLPKAFVDSLIPDSPYNLNKRIGKFEKVKVIWLSKPEV